MKKLLVAVILFLKVSESQGYLPALYSGMPVYPAPYVPPMYSYPPVEQYFRDMNSRKLADSKPKLFSVKPTVVGESLLVS